MPANEVIYCMVNEKGGPVNVTLRANDALAAGSDFVLWASDGTTRREGWKMSAGAVGQAIHQISAPSATIHNNYLSWAISVCSVHPGIEKGSVEIGISQDGVTCPLTKDLHWILEDVPQCDAPGDNVIIIRRKLTFKSA